MTADVTWPKELLRASNGRVQIVSSTVSGPRAMSGLSQAVASDAGYYVMPMTVPIRTNAQVRTWNSIEAILGGRVGTALIPALDCKRAPWPLVGVIPQTTATTQFSDPVSFSDGSTFDQIVIDAIAERAFAAGDIEVRIRVRLGGEFLAGQHFSASERLFRIARVLSSYTASSETVYDLRLALPVREAVALGTQLIFDCPLWRARLAGDSEMSVDLALLRFGEATINWEEDV